MPKEQTHWRTAALRRTVGMVKHWSHATGDDPSLASRKIRGERPSGVEQAEALVRSLAAHPKADPEPIIVHLQTVAEIEYARRETETLDLHRLIAHETEAQGPADVAQIALLDGHDADELDRAHEALSIHAARIRRVIAAIQILRGTA